MLRLRLRRLALLMLLSGMLAVRGLTPAGWMPGKNAAGGIALTLCNGMGGETVVITPDGKMERKQADHGRTDHPCAFAGVGVADVAQPVFAPLASTATAVALPARILIAATPGRGLAAPPPPPTGPPIFA